MSFFKSMLGDGEGEFSSKRTITFFAFVLCSIAFMANLGWGLKIDQFLYDTMVYIVIGGLGFTASERFAPKSKG
jgi:hypothetical protein